MSEFTPGKWEARPNRVMVEGHVLALVNGGNPANVRLIAAAPEMYELLRVLTAEPSSNSPDFLDELIIAFAVYKARKLLARSDGKNEAIHDAH